MMRHALRRPATAFAAVVLTLALTAPALVAAGAAAEAGIRAGSTAGAGAAVTGQKPESKIWFHAGSWWAVMVDPASATYHIFRLDRPGRSWVDTGTPVDSRLDSRADALADGDLLYISSHGTSGTSVSSWKAPSYVSKYVYDTSAGTYVRQPGFPVQVHSEPSEAMTITRTSDGRLWLSWVKDRQVRVAASDATGLRWGTPFTIPVTGANDLNADDISAIVAFGDRVGVMWSHQDRSAVFFAEHRLADAENVWDVSRTAVQGPNTADDHVNLRGLATDGKDGVYAVVKTSMDATNSKSAPQVLLLNRDPDSGEWGSHLVSRVSDCQTRPVLSIDATNGVAHVLSAGPTGTGCAYSGAAGTIYDKSAPLSTLEFPEGRGTPIIHSSSNDDVNNPTTSKQPATAGTGLVVLASSDADKAYWYADLPVADPTPPTPTPSPTGTTQDPTPTPTTTDPAPTSTSTPATTSTPTETTDPTPDPTTDPTPTGTSSSPPATPVASFSGGWTIHLTSSVTNATDLAWDFGDGTTSSETNPSHTYEAPGTYTITLTATGPGGQSSVRQDVTVGQVIAP